MPRNPLQIENRKLKILYRMVGVHQRDKLHKVTQNIVIICVEGFELQEVSEQPPSQQKEKLRESIV